MLLSWFVLLLILFGNGVHSDSDSDFELSPSSSVSPTIGQGYRLISIEATSNGGQLGLLQVKKTKHNWVSSKIGQLFVKHETNERLRVHITDAKNPRWEVPYNLLPRQQPPPPPPEKPIKKSTKPTSEHIGKNLIFSYSSDPFSFQVKRRSNNETLFNSHSSESDPYNNLVFKDQYLEISTKLPKQGFLYGLGENTEPNGIKLNPRNESYTLFSTDASASDVEKDFYGSHPVYLGMRTAETAALGVLLMNSNGMDVFYRERFLTYKVC